MGLNYTDSHREPGRIRACPPRALLHTVCTCVLQFVYKRKAANVNQFSKLIKYYCISPVIFHYFLIPQHSEEITLGTESL